MRLSGNIETPGRWWRPPVWIFSLCLLAAPASAVSAIDYAALELLDESALDALLERTPTPHSNPILITRAELISERDPAAALVALNEVEARLQSADSREFAYLNAVRCWAYQHVAELDNARRACQSAVSAGRAANDPRALSRALSRESILYFNLGNLVLADSVGREALLFAEAAGDSGQLSVALAVLGRIARAQGLYDQSLAYYSRGLSLLDPREDESRYRVLAFNVGLSHADLGQFEIAKDYYAETLAWTRANRRLRKELTALIYIAKADIGLRNFESAIVALTDAVNRQDFQFDPGHVASAFGTLGDVYLADDEPEKALVSYQRGLELAAGSDNRFEHRELRLGLGRALLATDQLPAARSVLERLNADLRAEGSNKILINSLLAFSETAQAQNDSGAALMAYQEANQLEARRNRMVADQRLALARAEFEVDEKELALARAERDALIRNGMLVLAVALLLIGYLFFSRRGQAQLAQARQQQSAKLEKVVAERTIELQEQMLRRAEADEARLHLQERLAEDEKLRVLGQLTGGVAHDFNNLLTVVMGSAELLHAKADELSARDRELLEHIIHAASSGAGITRALMAYARQQPLRLERTELAGFLKQLLPMIERTLGGSMRIDLQIDVTHPIEVLLDRDQLTTAILNLTLNARDAQNNNGVIRIRLLNVGDDLASLTVLDSGVGMSEEQIARACEPFYSTKSDGRGNGLGLSMVYGFTKQLGGDLKITSERGKGTEVRMLLPVATSSADLRVA